MVYYIKIADHNFKITYPSGRSANSFYIIYQSFLGALSEPADMSITITQGYGLPFQNYDVFIAESDEEIVFQRADYLIEVDPDYTKAKIYFHDELALKHAMMNLYSAFIVHNNWGLLIHSSCAVENGQGHIFSGHSGAGKSTAAKLSLPRQLLSDEAAILKITDTSVTVYDSPFRSELQAIGKMETAPLASINLLHQAWSNQRTGLKKSRALIQLMDKVFYWSYKQEETANILQLLQLLVEQVSVYDLHFQKNNSFWELISNDELCMQTGF